MILLPPTKIHRLSRIFVSCLVTLIFVRCAWTAEGILDYDRFKSQVEPLLTTRTYSSPGPGPMTCAACHANTSDPAYAAFPLVVGESRFNFTEAARRVRIDNPDISLLLLKPLSIVAGGTTHGIVGEDGGKQFQNTTSDAAYLTIQSWIVDATQASQGARISKTEPYPNPFRFSTHIVYFLTTPAIQVDVRIFTSSGHEVKSFVGTANVGANEVEWNGRDRDNEPLPTGVYFYSVKARFDDGTSLKSGRCVLTP